MKNILLVLSIAILSINAVYADCITGFACSIKDLEKQEQIKHNNKPPIDKQANNNKKDIKQKKYIKNKEYKSISNSNYSI